MLGFLTFNIDSKILIGAIIGFVPSFILWCLSERSKLNSEKRKANRDNLALRLQRRAEAAREIVSHLNDLDDATQAIFVNVYQLNNHDGSGYVSQQPFSITGLQSLYLPIATDFPELLEEYGALKDAFERCLVELNKLRNHLGSRVPTNTILEISLLDLENGWKFTKHRLMISLCVCIAKDRGQDAQALKDSMISLAPQSQSGSNISQ